MICDLCKKQTDEVWRIVDKDNKPDRAAGLYAYPVCPIMLYVCEECKSRLHLTLEGNMAGNDFEDIERQREQHETAGGY